MLNDSIAVLILGMPESGASDFAKALKCLGVFFGEDLELAEAALDSMDSGTELKSLAQFNRRCLSAFQMSAASTVSMPASWRNYPLAEVLRKQLRELLQATFGAQRIWGINQPMTTLLAPLYLDALSDLGVSPRFVVCARDPEEVASMPLRFSQDPSFRAIPPLGQQAVGVWLRYTLGGYEATENRDLITVPRHDFCQGPKRFLEGMIRTFTGWSPTAEQWSAALSSIYKCTQGGAGERAYCPDLVQRAWKVFRELADGSATRPDMDAIVDEFNLWKRMLASPGNPGTQAGLAWFDRGETHVAQVPFLPSGDWQTIRINVDAPPHTLLSGLLYGRPCRIWIRKCVWLSAQQRGLHPRTEGSHEMKAKLFPGPGSSLSEVGGILRLDGAYESQQISLRTPTHPGPYELEIEFLLEAGPQINVEAATRLGERIQKCVASRSALSARFAPGRSNDGTAKGPEAR